MPTNTRISRAFQLALVASAMLLAQSARAEDFIKGGDEHVILNLGGIVNQFNTSLSLNGATGPGTPIDLENGGLGKSLTSLQASGTWRWTERNRSDFLYFNAKRSGGRTFDHEITIGDTVFDANAEISAEAKDEFLFLDYRYSFFKSDELEFAGVLGLYGAKFKFNFSGTGKLAGAPTSTPASVTAADSTVSGSISSSSSTTVPLPLIGVSADWYIEPRWKVSSSLVGVQAKIDNVDGSAVVFQLGTDYMLTRNWGVGLSYMYTRLNVDVTKSGFNGKIDWVNNAVLAYATLKF